MDWFVFSENTGLYLYSALLQANAAILSLIGIYYIFKIQSLKLELEALKNYVFHNSGSTAAKSYYYNFNMTDLTGKKNILEKIIETKQLDKDPYNKFPTWFKIEIDIAFITKSVKFPSLLLAISIMLYAVCIVFAYQIHLQKSSYEIISFTVVLLVELYTIIMIIRGIFKVMQVPPLDFVERM